MVRSEQVSLSSTCRQTGIGALGHYGHWGIGASGHWGHYGALEALGHWGIGALGHLSVVSGQRSVVGSKGSTHCRTMPLASSTMESCSAAPGAASARRGSLSASSTPPQLSDSCPGRHSRLSVRTCDHSNGGGSHG